MNTIQSSNTTSASTPVLTRIARHERTALAEVAAAKTQAESIIAEADKEIAGIEAKAALALEDEIRQLEGEAAERRSMLRTAILALADSKARTEVESARSLLDEVVQSIIQFSLPVPKKDIGQ